MRIRIILFTLMRIRILLLVIVVRIWDHWSTRQTLHASIVSVPVPSLLHFWASKAPYFLLKCGSGSTSHSPADLDPASKQCVHAKSDPQRWWKIPNLSVSGYRPVCYFKTCIKISVYSFEMRESYSKKSIKPCWSEICQICQGKKIREIHIGQSQ